MNDSSPKQLLAGKIPPDLLSQFIRYLPVEDPGLLVGPSVGEDAAVIDFDPKSDRVLVAKSDPVTFATDELGYYAVNVCANDLAVTGATPRFYLPTVLLPSGAADIETAQRIFKQIGDACRTLGIAVAGGHSEITHAVVQPIVAGSMLGDAPRNGYVTSSGGKPGDMMLMAGVAPVEGTSIIARERRDELLSAGWTDGDIARAANFLYEPGLSVLEPARLAATLGLVTAMHDPTEGGILTGIAEIAAASGTGVEVDLDAIRVPGLSARLCAHFSLDPLGVIASGALLATADPANVMETLRQWRSIGWHGNVIGQLTKSPILIAMRNDERFELPVFPADEITKLWR